MKIDDIQNFASKLESKIHFDHCLKKFSWFNIGGKTKIFFKAESLKDLIGFLKIYNNRGKIFVLGAGSNILINDSTYDGVVIKLGKRFNNISKLDNDLIVAGSNVLDRKVSDFSIENSIGGLEFLSCIPGTIGGGIKMNSGCYEKEFKDILISIQVLDYSGNVNTIPSKNIDFFYRGTNLPNDLIFLSATLKGDKTDKDKIITKTKKLRSKKEISQPSKIKTGGSTFKNPIGKSNKKVWELIKESVPGNIQFGDAIISSKHSNFFVNKKNASFEDMKKLIFTVQDMVKQKQGIKLDLEIIFLE